MGFAAAERTDFCDAALTVGPDAPTLCAGWTASDLVAHVWIRENQQARVLPALLASSLAGTTDDLQRRALTRWGYRGLVELLRQGPPAGSAFALPGVDELANAVELFVHTEDLRRPNGLPRRVRSDAFEELLWRRVSAMALLLFRDAGVGLVLERADTGDTRRVRRGARTVTLVGAPSELMLFAFGRTQDADVQVWGPDADAVALREGHRGF